MDTDTNVERLISDAIVDHIFPGAVVGYIREGRTAILPFGQLTYEPKSPPVTAETVYDLASITKSVPTSSIILHLIETGKLSLDDHAATFIPELAGPEKEHILIKHLLTFTAVFDLPNRLAFFAPQGKTAIFDTIYSSPLQYPPGEHYRYSNIPMLFLGMIAEKVLGKPLDEIADELFFKPLGMATTTFHPERLPAATFAPTEVNELGEVVGRVHDETAWALYRAGMVSGHAGLFSTADDLLRFGEMLLNGGQYEGRYYFKPITVKKMWTEVVSDGKNGMALGWATGHAGYIDSPLPSHTFGKNGFTGTLLLMNPDRKSCLVLLSNRTYPKRPKTPEKINAVCRELAEIVL
jgi:CubicO group peptidase (beta-lactamase class C family)